MRNRQQPLALVTGNPGKLAESRRLASSLRLEAVDIDLPELQSLDLHEVAVAKAAEAWRRIGRPLIVEETGFELQALNGFPGPLVKWMLEAVGPEGIARVAIEAGDTRATARSILLYRDGDSTVEGEGATTGELVLPPRGEHGFGWDPVFAPQEAGGRTYGELEGDEKDALSHRGRAWRALVRALG